VPGVIVNDPGVDWLTFTSFDEEEEARLLRAFWACGSGSVTQAKQMQYEGIEKDNGVFIGIGWIPRESDEKGVKSRNVMLRTWGGTADDVWLSLSDEPVRVCKRIDVQITIPLPFDYCARTLKDSLESGDWFGRKRICELIERDGLDTVGIGSRSSDRYIRIYVKLINELRWLRFEVEYKQERAEEAYRIAGQGNRYLIGGMLRSELSQLPAVADIGLLKLKDALSYSSVTVKAVQREKDKDGRLDWLRTAVSPCLIKLLNDHDTRSEATAIVNGWTRLVQDLDKTSTA
jgi:hypothetical protein